MNSGGKRFCSIIILFAEFLLSANTMRAQNEKKTTPPGNTSYYIKESADKFVDLQKQSADCKHALQADTLNTADSTTEKDGKKQKVETQFVPDPKRALWLSLVLPGAGQIYNKKYWKLPIIYGGFIGCTYALLWNQQMYKDYSQAYLDLMDDDPNTASYKQMLPYGYDITGREEQFKNIFKHKRDFYRRNRDLSIFAFVGVYLLSVVDAYVDAQLSSFDISKDLSLKVEPAIIEQSRSLRPTRSVGLQCCIKF